MTKEFQTKLWELDDARANRSNVLGIASLNRFTVKMQIFWQVVKT